MAEALRDIRVIVFAITGVTKIRDGTGQTRDELKYGTGHDTVG